MMRIDLHTHSRASDGTDTPEALVKRAKAAALDVVALTDHDTFDGLAAAHAAAIRVGIGLLPGVEISAQLDGVSVHLLGYGCDTANLRLGGELRKIRTGRERRMPTMLAKLEELGMPVTLADVHAQSGGSPSVGRPHVADALVAKGYIASREEAFAGFLDDGGAAFVPRYSVEVVRGIRLIHGAGGVAVIAHPWGRVSRAVLTPDVLARLRNDHGLDGLEVDHGDHDQADRAQLRALAKQLGLLVTGGSDYHGDGKTGHDLGSETTAPGIWAKIADRSG